MNFLKFLGSKQKLLPHIGAAVGTIGASSVLDAFAGSQRVSHHLKRQGVYVVANDISTYSHRLGQVLVELDANTTDMEDLRRKVDLANVFITPRDGYFTQKFSREARFFQEHNARRIDGILHHLRTVDDPVWKAVLQVSLLLACDKIDSTCGIFNSYLKKWAPRSSKNLRLEMPELLPGYGLALQLDALAATEHISSGVDLWYGDPPYNQPRYDAYYHVWETLIRDDEPECYGMVNKRLDVKRTKNRFNSKVQAPAALKELLEAVQSPYILLSYSNEGYVTREWLEGILRQQRKHLAVAAIPFPRYIGSRIGGYSSDGQWVGEVTHTRNVEHLFLAGDDEAKVEQAIAAVMKKCEKI